MATGAPSAGGRSSQAAYLTLTLDKREAVRARSRGPHQTPLLRLMGWGVEPPFVFGSRNKRWLDFARHDRYRCVGSHAI
jgi:hypothetical protein